MVEFLKKLKFSYSLYNFFQKEKLIHNEAIYKKLGLNKKYYSSISSKDFEGITTEDVTLNPPLTYRLNASNAYHSLPFASQKSLQDFNDQGFAVLEGFYSNEQADKINSEIDGMLKDKKVGFRYRNKIMFAIHHSEYLKGIGEDKRLNEILSTLLNRKSVLFQSINFLSGSEQATHSDSIHMTTYPLGGLIAVWIALEDITEDNGPLHYFPGSHKLPYYLNSDFDNEGTEWFLGKNTYTDYEVMIQQKIKEHPLQKKVFLAKKGDVFIWHANLFHGGEPHKNKATTRKSMVLHYYSEGVICYHEITQRPALMPLRN